MAEITENYIITNGLDYLESDGNTSFLRAARNGHLDKVLEHLKTNIDINTSNANGLNALHLASKDGHVDVVEELLKRGAIVDAATKKGNTALHIASLAGQEEVVKLLVQHGASVNVQSQNGFTPLYMAAQENHDNVVRFLLANGANQSLSTEDGFTPLAVAMQQGHDKVVTVLLENDTRGKVRLPALHIAAKKDDVRAAKLLLEHEHNPDVTSKSGFTPLHIASHYGNKSIANLLIQKGADVNYSAKHNITPLHVAAKWGRSNMVALLLEQGAHIEAKTRDGLTPLHCAARSGHDQVVDMLLERSAPISSKTKNGLAPLHMAAQGEHVDAARILLYHRAPVDEVTVDYLTALHVAAHCGHVKVAKLLLDRQADANARALNGFTPLHIACKKNRIKVVELLLKHGACIGATTESGLTPLHVASFMGCMNIVIYLIQHDASPDIPTVRGETPLHLAARANQTDIIRVLLRNGAQVDARAREQQTPLHIASRLGNVDIVMLLIKHGANVDNTTKDLYTSLHIAAKEGQDEVAAALIENGASLNATTKKGFTPLHLAAKYGHLKVAKLLLQKEAIVDAQGKNGVTPLHVASHYDHQNVALLLLDKGASPHANAKNGHTPLHIAARKNQMDIAHTLLEYGAQPDAESKAGFTPLHLSSQEGHTDISSLLLEHKATPSHQSKNGLTPLHLCAQENKVGVAEVLCNNGAEIDVPTKGGYTPLHIASHYGQADMVKFLLSKGADVTAKTSLGYTPLHQGAQQGHTNIVNILLENSAQPNEVANNGQTPLNIAQKLGYITVIDTLKEVTENTQNSTPSEEKYRVVAPEAMQETFLSDSEEEGEDTLLGDQTYRYLTADEMKSLGDDSLPIDVTRDERIDSNRMVSSEDMNAYPPRNIEDSISPEHIQPNFVEYIKKTPDNIDISRHPVNIGFLVSFLVDARGGAMRGCRHSGVRVIVPPRCAPSPTRITCRYVRPQRTPHPPPLMEGEALASRVLELGPVGAKFLGPVIIEVPHFAALRGKEREIVILRSDNGESWKEHTIEANEDLMNDILRESFETDDLNQLEDTSSGRLTRIITQDFPQYFAVISRIRQEVHAIGPEGGMVSSTVVPQVQAVFPQGALTKKIKVGLQAQPIDPELTAKLLGHGVAVSPVVTVEPRRRKFHKAITLSMPAPRAHSQGMINQYSGTAPTLRLLCSITGGTSRAQWEDVTGSTPLTFVNDCVSFTTTVSARFWLMDCRNVGDATKMATELYREAIHVPFVAKFAVFAKRIDPLEARLRVFCMTDDKEEKTLEYQEQFTEIAKSRDVEVLEGKSQFIEFVGNLIPITKSGEQLEFSFRAFKENRLPFSVRVKDQHAEAVSRCLFMREPKVQKGEPPQQPICILNIVLPDDIVSDTISLTDSETFRRKYYTHDNFDYYRQDPRLADISNLLGDDWVDLANQLGLTTSEINVIKSEYPDSVAKQAQCMLRMWLSQSGNRAQTNTLENALRRIGRDDIVMQCLNVDNRQHQILRLRPEEKEKLRLRADEVIPTPKKYNLAENEVRSEMFDKYSAEEKTFEPSDEEEDFNKTVPERREQIVKRLSIERTIPASSQRVEIVQEICSIKRQSLVEDKIAEVQQKANIEPMKLTTIKPVSKIIQEKKILSEAANEKTTQPSDKTSEIIFNAQTIEEITEEPQIKVERKDSVLLEEVTQRLESRKPIPKLTTNEDPKSPKFSQTPPPSPADFAFKEKQATTAQEWDASKEEIINVSKDEPRLVSEEIKGKTTSTQYFNKLEENLLDKSVDPASLAFPEIEFSEFNYKNLLNETNAFIKSESIAEPYDATIDKINENLKEINKNVESPRLEKKGKKGILSGLKSLVSKSGEKSDSELEKSSPKKEKKDKKNRNVPEPSPAPLRKPRLPTPPESIEVSVKEESKEVSEPLGFAPKIKEAEKTTVIFESPQPESVKLITKTLIEEEVNHSNLNGNEVIEITTIIDNDQKLKEKNLDDKQEPEIIEKQDKEISKESPKHSEKKSKRSGILGFFTRKSKKGSYDVTDPQQELSEEHLENVRSTNSFLTTEKEKYEDAAYQTVETMMITPQMQHELDSKNKKPEKKAANKPENEKDLTYVKFYEDDMTYEPINVGYSENTEKQKKVQFEEPKAKVEETQQSEKLVCKLKEDSSVIKTTETKTHEEIKQMSNVSSKEDKKEIEQVTVTTLKTEPQQEIPKTETQVDAPKTILKIEEEKPSPSKSSKKKGLFKIFDRKKDTTEELPNVDNQIKITEEWIISKEILIEMIDKFLQDEQKVNHYTECQNFNKTEYDKKKINELETQEESIKLRKKDTNKDAKTKGIFKIFNRRSQEKEIIGNEEKPLKNKEETSVPVKEALPPLESAPISKHEDDVKAIPITNDFLNNEIKMYHDAPEFRAKDQTVVQIGSEVKPESVKLREKDKTSKTTRIFKIFNRKSQEREINLSDIENENIESPKGSPLKKKKEATTKDNKGIMNILSKKPDCCSENKKSQEEIEIIHTQENVKELNAEKEMLDQAKSMEDIKITNTEICIDVKENKLTDSTVIKDTGNELEKVSPEVLTKSTNDFLHKEREVFHDVMPKKPEIETQDTETKSAGVFKIFKSFKDEQKSIEHPDDDTKKTETKNKGIFRIFNKKSDSEERQITDEKESFNKNIFEPTNKFLSTEIELYHDVKYSSKEKIRETDSALKRIEPALETLEKTKLESVIPSETITKDEKQPKGKGIFKIFSKKSEEREIPEKITKQKQESPKKEISVDKNKIFGKKSGKTIGSENINVKNEENAAKSKKVIETTDEFLITEQTLYKTGDKPHKTGDQQEKTEITTKLHKIEDVNINKDGSHLKKDKEDNTTEKIKEQDKKHKQKGIFGMFSKKSEPSKDEENEQENNLKERKDTTEFLDTEKRVYHDVKYINKEPHPEASENIPAVELTITDTPKESKIESKVSDISGKVEDVSENFIKKSITVVTKTEKQISVDPKKKKEDSDQKEKEIKVEHHSPKATQPDKKQKQKGIFKIFSKSSESTKKDEDEEKEHHEHLKHTTDFLDTEKRLYHDVKYVKDATKSEKESTEKEVSIVISKDKELCPIIVEEKKEIKVDVQKQLETPNTKIQKEKETEKSTESDKKHKQKSIFNIFSSKKTEQSKNETDETAKSLQQKQETTEFLDTEKRVYHDVKYVETKKDAIDQNIKSLEDETVKPTNVKSITEESKKEIEVKIKGESQEPNDKTLKDKEIDVSSEKSTKPEKKHKQKGIFKMFNKKSESSKDEIDERAEYAHNKQQTFNFIDMEKYVYHDVKYIEVKSDAKDQEIKNEIVKEVHIENGAIQKDMKASVVPNEKEKEIKVISKSDEPKDKTIEKKRIDISSEKGTEPDKKHKQKGIFKMFGKKSEPTKEESDETAKNLQKKQQTTEFLDTEKKVYHDVKYVEVKSDEKGKNAKSPKGEVSKEVFKENDEIQKDVHPLTVQNLKENEVEVKSISDEPKHKTIEEKTIEKSIEPEKKPKQKGIFKMFNKKSESTKQESDETARNIQQKQQTTEFLDIEKKVYHDVKYIETKPEVKDQEVKSLETECVTEIHKENGAIQKEALPLTLQNVERSDVKVKSKLDETTDKTVKEIYLSSEKSTEHDKKHKQKGIFKMFSKKSEPTKEETDEKAKNLQEKQQTTDFLDIEKKVYHDVKYIETKPEVKPSESVCITEVHKEISAVQDMKPTDEREIEIKSKLEESTTKTITESTETHKKHKQKGIFNIFGKKAEQTKNEGQEIEKNLQERQQTSDFLDTEKKIYHDVKYLENSNKEVTVQENIILPEEVKPIKVESQKKSDVEIKNKLEQPTNKLLTEKEAESANEKSIDDKKHKQKGIFNIFSKKSEQTKIEADEIAENLKQKLETTVFLETEKQVYHDAEHTQKKTEIKELHKEISIKKETPEVFKEHIEIKETIHEAVLKDQKESKPSTEKSEPKVIEKETSEKPTSNEENKIEPKEKKSKGIFKIFGKKEKKQKDPQPQSIEIDTTQIFKENLMTTTDFLNKEKELYHDSEPQVLKKSLDKEHKLPNGAVKEEKISEGEKVEEKIISKKIKEDEKDAENKTLSKTTFSEDIIQLHQKEDSEKIEKDKLYERKTTETTIISVIGKKEDTTLTTIKGEDIATLELSKKVDQFLETEKQVYDDAKDSKISLKEEIIELPKQQEQTSSTEVEIKNGKTPQDSAIIQETEEPVIDESAIKSPKKKGILGFFKRKSRDIEASIPESTLKEITEDSHVTKTKTTDGSYIEEKKNTIDAGKSILESKIEKDSINQEMQESSKQSSKETLKKKKQKSKSKSLNEDEKDEKNKGILDFFSRRSKSKDREEILTEEEKKKISENYKKEIDDSRNFLEKETQMYHDVKLFCGTKDEKKIETPLLQTESKKEVSDKSSKKTGGIFKFFKKKSKDETKSGHDKVQQDQQQTESHIPKEDHSKNTASFIKNEIDYYEDVRPQTKETKHEKTDSFEETRLIENKNLIDVPEFTAFDFIKEEIENFQDTKVPFSDTIDSSFRVETEVEEIDGEFPKEIIRKKIIISEKLIEKLDQGSSGGTSEQILEKLMNMNKELKETMIDKPKAATSGSKEKLGIFEKKSGSQEKIENINIEYAEMLKDLEMAKGDVVEDVSPLESQIESLLPKISQEKVTDLDEALNNVQVYQKNDSPSKKNDITKIVEKDSGSIPNIKQITEDFVKDIKIQYHPDEMSKEDANMFRTVSQNTIGDQKETPKKRKISEANIDLSNLRQEIEDAVINQTSPYVTSPTTVRRTLSHKITNINRPVVTEIVDEPTVVSDVIEYVVTDPEESLSPSGSTKRKPLFRLESDEDDFITTVKIERSGSAKSNILETLNDNTLDELLNDLKTQISDSTSSDSINKNNKEEIKITYEIKREDSTASDVQIIEEKLRDLGKALDTLEKLNETNDENREKKLKRVERKFERMASEILESSTASDQTIAENKQYQQLVSQLSTDEVMSFQKEYNNLWDEYTFSKSDEWDSKTPDSQADVLELPQGDAAFVPRPSETAPFRGETDEPTSSDRDEGSMRSQQMDQHQISEEMKELLREMEKSSKQ